MAKRNSNTDVPRRIDAIVIKRINKHLESKDLKLVSRKVTKGSVSVVKYEFNAFLSLLLDVYEALEASPKVYVNKYFASLDEARGESIMESVKNKQPAKWPLVMVQVGKDE